MLTYDRSENRHVTAGLLAGPVPDTAPVRPALPRSVGQSEETGTLGAVDSALPSPCTAATSVLSFCAAISSLPSSSGPRSAMNPSSATTGMSANNNQDVFLAIPLCLLESGLVMDSPLHR
jgi:hypothetical protein